MVAVLQNHLAHLPAAPSEFQTKGRQSCCNVSQFPDEVVVMMENNERELEAISDEGNELSKGLGIVFKQPKSIRRSRSLGYISRQGTVTIH